MSDRDSRSLERIRVVIPTSRDVYRLASYGMVVDFENAVAAVSDADLVPVPLYSRRAQMQGLLRREPLRAVTAPRSRYDVCLLVAMAPYWLPTLRYVRDLRRVARRVVVYLFDSWLSDLPTLRAYRRLWPLIDDLFVSFRHSVEPYAEQLPCRVHYLPQGIDAGCFYPTQDRHRIDVLSIGRRLGTVHEQLLAISRRRDLFYHYQTHAAPQVIDFQENQELIGRLCRLAQVHVSWPLDRTNPLRAGEGAAITARWFESAASGAVIMGMAPRTDEFARLFPLEDFVVDLEPGTTSRAEETLEAARSASGTDERRALAEHVRSAHTWSVRWRQIVELCDL